MNSATPLKNKTLSVRNSIGRSPLRYGQFLIALAWLALSPAAPAVTPAPDGGYANNNTAEGTDALFSLTSGADNTAIGVDALYRNTTGSLNTATGFRALLNNTSGIWNTATGVQALLLNIDGNYNTANGVDALYNNTHGSFNTAIGQSALLANTTGGSNTAAGSNALGSNTTGSFNTATGLAALTNNTTGQANTANGVNALYHNSTGGGNTATGVDALYNNTTGNSNTANGEEALLGNTTGSSNTANGVAALQFNTTGFSNTANGVSALQNNTTGHDNTADGLNALLNNTTGSNNVALGTRAGANLTTGSNNIELGASVIGAAGEANTIRIGKQGTQKSTLIAGIFGTAVTGSQVVVNSNGKLGVAASSARFKEAVKPMDKVSEAILSLKPVSFRYKEEIDPDGTPQFGLIAEEVEKINPDLVVRDADGKINTVRYEAVNTMLLNEFLKEHRMVQELKSIVAKQEATNAQQQKQIEALSTGLEKVNKQLQPSSSAPQIAANDY